MKRNQFFLTTIGLLAKAMFFFFLGLTAGEFLNEDEFLIKVDDAVVSMSTEDKSYSELAVLPSLSEAYVYTQTLDEVAMNEQRYGYLLGSIIKEEMRVINFSGVIILFNYFLDKPPRMVNTS